MTELRPLLVGEMNPYGSDPAFALYPLPEDASGGRLARILGLSKAQYLRLFDRVNLCVGRWNLQDARARRMEIQTLDARTFVLLGAKVCRAFGEEFLPFTIASRGQHQLIRLPHPSGRNLLWNQESNRERARELLRSVGALPR